MTTTTTTTCNLPLDILDTIGKFSAMDFTTKEYKRLSNYKKGYKISKIVKNCNFCNLHDNKIKTYYTTDRYLSYDMITKGYLKKFEICDVCDNCISIRRKYGSHQKMKTTLVNPKFLEKCNRYSVFYNQDDIKPIKNIEYYVLIIRQEKAKAELSKGESDMVEITQSFIIKSKIDKFFGVEKIKKTKKRHRNVPIEMLI